MARRLFTFGPFTLDTERATLLRNGRPMDIGHRALGVLHALLKANGQVVTKAELIEFAWRGAVVEESNLSVQIAALRKLLGVAPEGADWIATVSRIGYRFIGPLTITEAADEVAPDSAASRP